MNIEVPLLVLKLSNKLKPRYLVMQTEMRGAANTPTVVYADAFYSRTRAVRATHAADERLRVKVGNLYLGKRKPSLPVKLPTDSR